jgi:hypothetical protein
MPYLANKFIERPSEQYTASDWKEVIGDEQPGGSEALSLESGEATMVINVPWLKARSFVQFALGWSYADDPAGGSYRLRRENPQPHPRFAWLTASTVSFNARAPVGVAGVGTRVPGVFVGSLPVGKYDHVYATVRFTDKPWFFLPDDQAQAPATELRRNVYLDPVPSIEIISAEGLNNIAFANGPHAGAAVPAPFGTLMSKCTYTLNWMWVPHEYLSGADPYVFRPARLEACTGRVNSDTFLGFPPMTLLMQAPRYVRFKFPILTTAGVASGYFGWNVQIPLQYFEPPRGTSSSTLGGGNQLTLVLGAAPLNATGTIDLSWVVLGVGKARYGVTVTAVTAPGVLPAIVTFDNTTGTGDAFPANGTTIFFFDNNYRGHQLIPLRNNLLWYGARRQDGTSKLYSEAAFTDIFKHVNAP